MTGSILSIDPAQFEVLTFDCYGTLIDWEAGIYDALRPILIAHGTPLEKEAVLELYAGIEAEVEGREPFRNYRAVLEEAVEEIGTSLGWEPTSTERRALWASLPNWPPFPDVAGALRALKQAYRLAVVSNVDDDLFAGTSRQLNIGFDWVVTAQRVRAYKPDLLVFEYALETIGVDKQAVLHVAQSLFHDIAPARQCGLTTVWVDRRRGRKGSGATPPAHVLPHCVVPDLNTLVSHMVQT